MSQGHILLAGFMGSGKTTIGKMVAKEINRPFHDLDEVIEQMSQQTINEWFQLGEVEFRKYEKELLLTLLGFENAVIALGGGTLSNTFLLPVIDMIMKQHTLVWLDVSFEESMMRVKQGHHQHTRPLLYIGIEELKKLYHARQITYKNAPIRVSAEQSETQITKEIIHYCTMIHLQK